MLLKTRRTDSELLKLRVALLKMKGINKTMNHIVEEEKKDELTTYIEDGYKVIYPNNNLSIKLIRKYRDDSWDSVRTASHIKSSLNCWGISLYDRLVKNKNSLFLSPGDFNSGALKLVIKRARAEATIDLRAVRIYSDEDYLGIKTQFYEKIKYILFNAESKNLKIVIDQNFKTNAAKKHEQILNENKNLAKELGI